MSQALEIIKNESYKWYEKTVDWKKEDWLNFQIEQFDKYKNSKWTLEKFPKLKEVSYEDLPNFESTDYWPSPPEGFPTFRKVSTTGTVSVKYVEFSKDDYMHNARVVGAACLKLYDENIRENGLLIGGYEGSASAGAARVFSLFFKKYYLTFGDQFVEELDKIIESSPFTYVFGPQVVSISLLELLKERNANIFSDNVVFINFADILYKSFIEYVGDVLGSFGINKFNISDAYGATESTVIAIAYDYKFGNMNLIMAPDISAMVLEKEDGERVNLFDAKKGDKGEILITPMRDFMVPNYRLGDIVEVVGINKRTGLPELKVWGRRTYKVQFEHPAFGTVKGVTGAVIRLIGVPLNTYGLDEVISKFAPKYFAIVREESINKFVMTIYTQNKIDIEDFVQALSQHPLTKALHVMVKSKALDIDVEVVDMKLLDYVLRNWKGGQIKTPKVVVVRKNSDSE